MYLLCSLLQIARGGKKDCKKYILFLLEKLNVSSDSLDVIKFSIYFKYKKTIERKAESWG